MSTEAAQWLRYVVPAGILCLLSVHSPAASTNSPWAVHAWRSDDGLPNNEVMSLAQTADGYIWMATDSRLARFDGAQFEEFMTRTFLPGAERKVTTLLRGHDDELFFAMAQGQVGSLKNGVTQIYTNHLPDRAVRSLFEDNDDTLWVVSYDGTLSRIRNGKVELLSHEKNNIPTNGYFCSVMADRNGQVWIAKGGKL